MPATKPYLVLEQEKKSHRTKDEIMQRREAEKATITGQKMKEWPEIRENKVAHKEFLRTKKVLEAIDKFDEIFAPVVNRYCLLQAECKDFKEKREHFYQNIQKLEEDYENDPGCMKPKEYHQLQAQMETVLISCDKQVQAKRKMLLDLEKEMCLTVASALRSIPKKAKKEEDPLKGILKR
ncbi:hypothetical protein NIA71_01260 [Ihubacter massiliensis]|uniref:hypothetical protein n=1 Tax=Ihubacter massiliensis TaxID=1852367 RepID=UPI0020983DBC|nr:hypothetical protein [Ihubacter massiliensis]MCI7301311.1 hypothetical protein [Clostridia bacterium]MCO7120583.1 hypothetical protein [Ihubacter massiliensis]MDY3010609.1 hypothetical protein [Clostridiales Family XIII bacterium]